jgi:hypothetical protein
MSGSLGAIAPLAMSASSYRLKNIQAVSANRTIATIQRDESLIPVFLAMRHILTLISEFLPDKTRGRVFLVNSAISS